MLVFYWFSILVCHILFHLSLSFQILLACLLLILYSCLSHIIPFEFIFSNFSFTCFISWLPLLHKFGELVVLEVVHQEVVLFNIIWVLLLSSRLSTKKRKRDLREAILEYFISKKQIKTLLGELYQTPYICPCNFL